MATATNGTPVVTGLLYSTQDCGVWHYNMPALGYELKIIHQENGYQFQAVIKSIDDAGLTVYGPEGESQDKAVARLEKFQFFINSAMYACPSKSDMTEICKEINICVQYW
jgi:hypothetical protein